LWCGKIKLKFLYFLGLFLILAIFTNCSNPAAGVEQGLGATEITLIAPETGSAQSAPVDFQREGSEETGSFQFQLSATKDFSSPIMSRTVDSTRLKIEALPSADIDGKGADNKRISYYWRVKAVDGENTENWSPTYHFTINLDEKPAISDRDALMELYRATNGDDWNNNSGWGSDAPIGQWYRIDTDANVRVTRIDLYKNNLRGELPASIGNLDKVVYLNTKNNHLSGHIPMEIGNMASLEWLILAGRTY